VFAIIGSGFGLYGYLPALIECCAEDIVLPTRYRPAFHARPELQRFSGRVAFECDEAAALDHAGGAVIAQRPVDQPAWVSQCLRRPNIQQLILEKPLAPSPTASANVLDVLLRSKRAFRIGYVFRHTPWGKCFLRAVSATGGRGRISIRWTFMAHHFRHGLQNWKRFNSSGGGAIRFYGIQMIALAAEAGFKDVVISRAAGRSPEEIDRWTATFAGRGLAECDVAIDTRSRTSGFRVRQRGDPTANANVFADLSDPLEAPPGTGSHLPGDLDRRVGLLGQLCRSVRDGSTDEYQWYGTTIRLWRRIEDDTHFELAPKTTQCLKSRVTRTRRSLLTQNLPS
jgi:hypothetical protein